MLFKIQNIAWGLEFTLKRQRCG